MRIADEGRHAARLAAQAIEEQVEDQQPEKSLGFAAAGREIEEARRELVAEGVEAVGKFGHARRERRNMRENEGELEQPPVGVATAAIMREGLVRVQPGAPGRCLPAQGGAAVRIAFVRRRRTGIAGCDERSEAHTSELQSLMR